jgi:hypothetical protein
MMTGTNLWYERDLWERAWTQARSHKLLDSTYL